ncbi:MAG TPA: hypothetical protein VF622_18950 [Segetibacter sp.]
MSKGHHIQLSKNTIRYIKTNYEKMSNRELAAAIGLKLQKLEDQKKVRRREPLFKNKVVDYTQLISVRIDNKTIIYAKPGEDIEAVKRKFKGSLKAS